MFMAELKTQKVMQPVLVVSEKAAEKKPARVKVTKPNSETIYFINTLNNLGLDKESKAFAASGAVLRGLEKTFLVDYNDDVEGLRIDHCSVDEKTKNIIKDKEGNKEFTKEGENAFRKAVKELGQRKSTIEIRTASASDFSDAPAYIVEFLIEFGFLIS